MTWMCFVHDSTTINWWTCRICCPVQSCKLAAAFSGWLLHCAGSGWHLDQFNTCPVTDQSDHIKWVASQSNTDGWLKPCIIGSWRLNRAKIGLLSAWPCRFGGENIPVRSLQGIWRQSSVIARIRDWICKDLGLWLGTSVLTSDQSAQNAPVNTDPCLPHLLSSNGCWS